ncbi:hypothetical protein N7526_010568 [Penicillium atrosanguineum]|nr:hypothetical protein N7526_010568 [Penicillium atrosanguineum]
MSMICITRNANSSAPNTAVLFRDLENISSKITSSSDTSVWPPRKSSRHADAIMLVHLYALSALSIHLRGKILISVTFCTVPTGPGYHLVVQASTKEPLEKRIHSIPTSHSQVRALRRFKHRVDQQTLLERSATIIPSLGGMVQHRIPRCLQVPPPPHSEATPVQTTPQVMQSTALTPDSLPQGLVALITNPGSLIVVHRTWNNDHTGKDLA